MSRLYYILGYKKGSYLTSYQVEFALGEIVKHCFTDRNQKIVKAPNQFK